MEDLVTDILAEARDAAHNLERAQTAGFSWSKSIKWNK